MNCNFPFVCFHIVYSKFGFVFFAKSWSFSDQFQLDLARGFCLGNVLKLNFVEICDNFAIVSSFFFV